MKDYLYTKLNNFLGINELNNITQSFMRRFMTFQLIAMFIGYISSTFYVLYITQKFDFVFYAELTSIAFTVQFLLDYISGSLGDWIGQKSVIFISMFLFGIVNLLIGIAVTKNEFRLAFVILGIAAAQMSGSWQSLFENNYKILSGSQDLDRKIVGFFSSRVFSINSVLVVLALNLGGIIATFSRQLLFVIQGVIYFAFSFLILVFIKNKYYSESDIASDLDSLKPKKGYFKILSEGLVIFLKNRPVFLIILSTVFNTVAWNIWAGLLLFPIYFGYTGSDVGTTIVRSLVYIIGLYFTIKIATQSKKIANANKWIGLFQILFSVIFFGLYFLLVSYFPLLNSLNPTAIILTIFFYIPFFTLLQLVNILKQRIMIDIIPPENRNSIYSLPPTLSTMLSIPVVLGAGIIINSYGFNFGIFYAGFFSVIAGILLIIFYKVSKPVNSVISP